MRFEIEPKLGGVSLPTYSSATFTLLQLLRELDSAISGKFGGMVEWYVVNADKNGTLTLEIESKVKPPPKKPKIRSYDSAPAVARSFVTGFENIEQRGISPPYLSESGLQKLQQMVGLLHRNGAKSFIATSIDDNRSISVTEKSATTLRDLLPTRREEIGTVEGRLETISIHKAKKFIIYESLTGKGVTCILSNDSLLNRAMEILGRKVVVSGLIAFNIKNEPIRIAVSGIRILRESKDLPKARDLTGTDPDFTGDLTTDEYIRGIRRG